MSRFFTSESVTEGHPDKLCDQLSDAMLDDCLRADPQSRVACECSAATGFVLVMGEVTTKADLNIQLTARDVIKSIGYDRAEYGFDAETCAVLVALHGQSPDIAMGVDAALEGRGSGAADLGAGDQGMMFGYACDETPERMPAPIALAHRLTKRLAEARKTGLIAYLRPDGKAQVTVEYDGDTPVRIDTVVVSTQHDPDAAHAAIEQDVIKHVVKAALPAELLDEKTRYLVNPTGRFVIGGPMGDSGLTGRKIIVDTYGGYARHGGGAFSGKDPTKVDRSAAYALRHIALNVVAAGLARRVELEAAYAIGVAQPVSLFVDTYGTGVMPDERLTALLREAFDLRPGAIIRDLGLRRPIYRQTATYGHFGRTDLELPWECANRVDDLKALAARMA